MDIATIINKFGYHKPSDAGREAHAEVRSMMMSIALAVSMLPKCDDRDKAIDHIRLACMYANAAVAVNGSPVELEELDDDLLDVIHEMIADSKEPAEREVIISDIRNFLNENNPKSVPILPPPGQNPALPL